MPAGKKLTLNMKHLLEKEGLTPDDWLYTKNTMALLVLINRETGKKKIIEKRR